MKQIMAWVVAAELSFGAVFGAYTIQDGINTKLELQSIGYEF